MATKVFRKGFSFHHQSSTCFCSKSAMPTDFICQRQGPTIQVHIVVETKQRRIFMVKQRMVGKEKNFFFESVRAGTSNF